MRIYLLTALSLCAVNAASALGQDALPPVAPHVVPANTRAVGADGPSALQKDLGAGKMPALPAKGADEPSALQGHAHGGAGKMPALPADQVRTLLDSITDPEWTAEPSVVVPVTSQLPLPPKQTPELLQEFRCESVTVKRFTRTQRTVYVFIYNFPDARTAFGAYSTMRVGSSNVLVRGDASSEDDSAISILKGSRFITITSTAEEDEVSKHLQSSIADQLGSKIVEDAKPPQQIYSLPVLDKMRGSERIFMGPIAARKYMAIPFINALQINESGGATFADYQFPHPDADRLKLMIIEYGDPLRAQNIYKDYAAKVAVANKSKPLSPSSQLSRVGQKYLLCMHSGTRVVVIAGAQRKISPMVLARQLAY